MLRQQYIEKNLLFYAIVCNILVNYTRGVRWMEKKWQTLFSEWRRKSGVGVKVKNCHSVSGIVLNDPVVFGKREIWKSRMKTKPWILPPCAVVKTMWCFSFYWSDSKLKTKDSSFWFSLTNSETVKAITLAFATSINVSLETFMPSLVSLTRPSLQILGKTQTGVFPISGYLVYPL